MAATMHDIRQKTGLSLATISKYINGGNVRPENKVKIEAAIKDLNYQVNEIARGLVTNRMRTVGVIVYSIESVFCGTLLRYIGEALRKNGYALIICDSCNDETIEGENVCFLMSKKVDGLIVVPVSANSGFLASALNAELPVVLVDRIFRDITLNCVRIDNRMSSYRAVNILIQNHHKKIAVISADKDSYTGYERYCGYVEAMEQADMPLIDEYLKKGSHSIEFGYQSMKELLALKERPTAVFASNYEITLGAVMAFNESHVSCPEDISILGFDNLLLSHIVEPRICMVVQPMSEMSERAVALLLDLINRKDTEPPMEIVLGTSIQEGGSIRDISA